MHEVLIKFGFIRAFADDCLYIKCYEERIVLLILVYVDDMAVVGPDGCHIVSFKSFLGNNFEITDLDKLKHMLEVLVTRDCLKHLIYLNQTAYIQRTIACFGLENSTLVSIPFIVKHDLTLSQLPTTEAEMCAYKDYSSNLHYLSLVGSLLFVIQTRPDIQFVVGLVTQFSNNPGIAYLEAAKHILCYLKSTTNYNLVLEKREEGKFNLVRWSNSN